MMPEISVVISAHNPHPDRFGRALQGLLRQTLLPLRWELVLVDNASWPPIDFAALAHRFENIVPIREERLGLAFGRLAGIQRSRAGILVFIDDDNVVGPDYLQNSLAIFHRHPGLGLGGGKSLPEWESGDPEAWVRESYGNLALRDLGDHELLASLSTPRVYPACAPIGAGMIARRGAIQGWVSRCAGDAVLTGRRGSELASGEDCDIVLSALQDGWSVGYFPELSLIHLIASARVTREYLSRLNYGIAKSWIQVLARHGIYPWPPAAPWSVPFRKARAYFRCRVWDGPAEYVRWKGACGQFDGRAEIPTSEGHPGRAY